MNNEIKETLEYKIDFLTNSLNIGIPTKNRRYFNDIKDYITNLQQIEQEHKKINGELREENSKLEIALQNIQEDYDRRAKENERLKGDNEFLKKEIIKLERKYLKEDLLNILQNERNKGEK